MSPPNSYRYKQDLTIELVVSSHNGILVDYGFLLS